MTEKEKDDALQRAIPRPPRVIELGGGIYYKCFWTACDEDLKKWYDYCPHCGTAIAWSENDDF